MIASILQCEGMQSQSLPRSPRSKAIIADCVNKLRCRAD